MSFEKLISPLFIKVLYWFGLAGICVFGLVSSLATFGLGFILALFMALFWRIWMEMLIVAFGIHDRLGDIRDNSAATVQAAAPSVSQTSVALGISVESVEPRMMRRLCSATHVEAGSLPKPKHRI